MSAEAQFPLRLPPANMRVLIAGPSYLTTEIATCLSVCGVLVFQHVPNHSEATFPQVSSLLEAIQQRTIDVVVLADYSHTQIGPIDSLCRNYNVGLVLCGCTGLIGYIWVDFGPEFTVLDETAEELRWYDIVHIAKDSPCTITLNSEGFQSFTLQSGVHVTINGVPGIDPNTVFPLEVVDKDCCRVPVDRTMATDYEKGGVLTEVKIPRICKFDSYEESWRDVKCIQTDVYENPKTREIHIIRLTLDLFKSTYDRFPALSNPDEIQAFMQLQSSLFPGMEVSEKQVKTAVEAAGQYIHPAGLCIAGLVTAEVLKYSGQGSPLTSWLYMDWTALATPNGSEGAKYQERLISVRLMLVGNSAISREILRQLPYLRICSSGLVLQSSSPIPSLSPPSPFPYQSKSEELLPSYDSAYSDELWESLDFVLIASNNTAEIRHAADRCIWFEKPHVIFDSSGTKGTIQVVFPHRTQTYTENQSYSKEVYTPILKPFYGKATTEGCIYSAFGELQTVFQTYPEKALEYSKDPSQIRANTSDLERLAEFLGRLDNVKKYEDCVAWACAFCHFHLYGQVELLRKCMEERKGENEFGDYRKIPVPVELDLADFEHLRLVELLAEHCAGLLSIPFPSEPASTGHSQPNTIKDWSLSPSLESNLHLYSDLISRIRPIIFTETDEKHCEMVRIFACLKARIFSIPEPNQAKTKAVLSPFLPAHPATSTLAAGAGLIEILKFVHFPAFSTLRNSIFSLIQPLFLSLPPLPCVQTHSKAYDPLLMCPVIALPEGFTAWDKFVTIENCTFTQFFAYFRANYALEVEMIGIEAMLLYNKYFPQKYSQAVDLQIHEMYERRGKKGCLEGRKSLKLTVACENQAGDSEK